MGCNAKIEVYKAGRDPCPTLPQLQEAYCVLEGPCDRKCISNGFSQHAAQKEKCIQRFFLSDNALERRSITFFDRF